MGNFWHDLGMTLANEGIKFLASVLVMVLIGAGTQYFRLLTSELKQKNSTLYDLLSVIAKEAVHAAEQLGINKIIEDKKQFAIDYVQRELEARGIYGIDVDMIADKIEAQVFSEINKYKELPPSDGSQG